MLSYYLTISFGKHTEQNSIVLMLHLQLCQSISGCNQAKAAMFCAEDFASIMVPIHPEASPSIHS